MGVGFLILQLDFFVGPESSLTITNGAALNGFMKESFIKANRAFEMFFQF